MEGPNDREAIGQLLRSHSIVLKDFAEQFEVLEGFDLFREDFPASLLRPNVGLATQLVILDADSNVASRWQSITDVLRKMGYQRLPAVPDSAGSIIPAADGLPRIGLWLMPNNEFPGALEEFAAMNVAADRRPMLDHARSVVDQLPSELRRFRPVQASKAAIHTFLAWQESPGEPIGLAFQARVFDPQAELACAFINWFVPLWEES